MRNKPDQRGAAHPHGVSPDRSARSDEDPWERFAAYLENRFAVQAGARGFNGFLSRRGAARLDITLADIVNLIWSNGRIIDATSATAPTAWRHQLHLMLGACRAERAHPIPEPPMTEQQLYDAMVHLSAVKQARRRSPGHLRRAPESLKDQPAGRRCLQA